MRTVNLLQTVMLPTALLLAASCMATFPPHREARREVSPASPGGQSSPDAEAASPQDEPGPPVYALHEEGERLALVEKARSMVGVRDLRLADPVYRRNDCTGFVVGVYRSLGYHLPLRSHGGTSRISELLFRNLRESRLTFYNAAPRIGDVVFFKGTIPGNPGRITHVGLIAALEDDGTVEIIHYSSLGVAEIHMNLNHPRRHALEDGRVINDYVRKRPEGYANVPLLAGELFHAYGDLYTFAKLN